MFTSPTKKDTYAAYARSLLGFPAKLRANSDKPRTAASTTKGEETDPRRAPELNRDQRSQNLCLCVLPFDPFSFGLRET